jgi:hypothetical protein
MDRTRGDYTDEVDEKWLADRGVRIIDCPLITPESAPYIDEKLLAPVLFSLA